MRSRLKVFVAGALVGLAFLLLLGFVNTTSDAFTIGVPPNGLAAVLEPGSEACQGPIAVPPAGGFDRVSFQAGTYHRPGPALAVSIRDAGGRVVGRGRLGGGYPDVAEAGRHHVEVGEFAAGRVIDVCVANRGDRPAALYGSAGAASRTTVGVQDGQPLETDLDFAFHRDPRPLAALAPVVARRASLFTAGFVKPWMTAAVMVLALAVVPVLLALSLRLTGDAATRRPAEASEPVGDAGA